MPAGCAALAEGKGMTSSMRELLGQDAARHDAIDASGCDGALLRKLSDVSAISPELVGDLTGWESPLERWVRTDAGK